MRLRKTEKSDGNGTWFELLGKCGACMTCNPRACIGCNGNKKFESSMFTFMPGEGVEANYRNGYNAY